MLRLLFDFNRLKDSTFNVRFLLVSFLLFARTFLRGVSSLRLLPKFSLDFVLLELRIPLGSKEVAILLTPIEGFIVRFDSASR